MPNGADVANGAHVPNGAHEATGAQVANGAEVPNGGHPRGSRLPSITCNSFAPESTSEKESKRTGFSGGGQPATILWVGGKMASPRRRGVAP